jgi:chaperone LolA
MLCNRIVVILLAVFVFIALSSFANAKTIDDYLGHVKSMSANFDQFVYNESTKEPEQSTGSISVLSPDKFRLSYNKPYKQIYVADGIKLWSYDEDLEQVTVKKQQGLLANSPAIVLGNPAGLKKAYEIKAQGITNNIDWFYMTPKSPDSQFDHIRLGFTGNNLYVMELYDSFGQRTQLRFSELLYNPELGTEHFKFKAPDGVDIVGDVE